MRIAGVWSAILVVVLVTTEGCSGDAAVERDEFPRGTVRIVVGYAAGGGYDLGARLVARHLSRHLPGSPAVIVENMAGAGGLIATKYLASSAAADGLTLGLLASNSFAPFGTGAADAGPPGFGVLGSPAPVLPVCAFARRSGITTMNGWLRATRPPRMGTAGPGSISHVITRILEQAAGVPARLVPGYSGSAEARLALTNGELDGFCATWETLEGPVRQGTDLVPVLRLGEGTIPGFETLPDAMSVARDERGRRLLSVGIYATNALGRVYVTPPRVASPVLAVLRTALASTFADLAFRQDAAAANVSLAPLSAVDVESALARVTGDQKTIDELRVLLAPR